MSPACPGPNLVSPPEPLPPRDLRPRSPLGVPLPFLRLPTHQGFFVDKWLYHWDMEHATRRYGAESGLSALLDDWPADRLMTELSVVGDIWITEAPPS